MSRALRIVEGCYGRLVLMEATTPLAPHAHREHLVLIKVAGTDGAYRVRGSRVRFTRSSVVFVNALDLHDNGRSDAEEAPTILLALYLKPEWLAELAPALFRGIRRPFPRVEGRITPEVRRRGDLLAEAMLRSEHYRDGFELLVQDLVLMLAHSYLVRGRDAPDAWRDSRFSDHRIRRAIESMRADPRKSLRIGRLASAVGLSRSRFYDLFGACTGVPPQAYLDMLCAERAASRLATGDDEVRTVARELGFSTQGNFARFYVRQFGIAPAQYRRAAVPRSNGAGARAVRGRETASR